MSASLNPKRILKYNFSYSYAASHYDKNHATKYEMRLAMLFHVFFAFVLNSFHSSPGLYK